MNNAVNPKRVLIIDDNRGILFIMQKVLELKNYEVHVADSFKGIQTIEKISPDVIFLDVSLSGKDGRAISRELKSHDATKNIPIIIMTAHANARELAIEANADDYLSKPNDLWHLWQKVEKHTAKS